MRAVCSEFHDTILLTLSFSFHWAKPTIHQVTTMLATSKSVLFAGHNHRYWWPFTGWCSGDYQRVESSVLVVGRWLWSGNRTFLELASVVVIWWIMAFFAQCCDMHGVDKMKALHWFWLSSVLIHCNNRVMGPSWKSEESECHYSYVTCLWWWLCCESGTAVGNCCNRPSHDKCIHF